MCRFYQIPKDPCFHLFRIISIWSIELRVVLPPVFASNQINWRWPLSPRFSWDMQWQQRTLQSLPVVHVLSSTRRFKNVPCVVVYNKKFSNFSSCAKSNFLSFRELWKLEACSTGSYAYAFTRFNQAVGNGCQRTWLSETAARIMPRVKLDHSK